MALSSASPGVSGPGKITVAERLPGRRGSRSSMPTKWWTTSTAGRPRGRAVREALRAPGPRPGRGRSEPTSGSGSSPPPGVARRSGEDPPARPRGPAALVRGAGEGWRGARRDRGELLVETGGRERYDYIIAVSAPEAVRLERAVRRSGEFHREGLRRRIAAQMQDAEREKSADVVVESSGTKDELLVRVDGLAARLKELAQRGGGSA